MNPLAFVLIVMFAGSAAFLSPVGYLTNLFVCGPGGYEFTDYARVGAPLPPRSVFLSSRRSPSRCISVCEAALRAGR